jgi:hypothetical protein
MLILVCDGDELKAVKKGFAPLNNCFLPLPIGCEAVNQLLQTRQLTQQPILLIGLAGSLSSQYQVGDMVIYETCSYFHQGKINSKKCDRYFTQLLQAQLNAPLVNGLTSNKLIISPQEKFNLNQESHCQVIDMESYAVMNYFSSVTVVRVISDNYQDSLPDLNSAIVDGQLDKIKMSIAFIQEPFKAIKLIKNALISLRQLELVSKQIGKIIHNSSEFVI